MWCRDDHDVRYKGSIVSWKTRPQSPACHPDGHAHRCVIRCNSCTAFFGGYLRRCSIHCARLKPPKIVSHHVPRTKTLTWFGPADGPLDDWQSRMQQGYCKEKKRIQKCENQGRNRLNTMIEWKKEDGGSSEKDTTLFFPFLFGTFPLHWSVSDQ
jgi:hypothetical protein